jgi:NADH-quinone oxidoreductase subunit J
MEQVIFGLCAFVSVASALIVVTRKNPIYSAFFLILTFLALAVALIPIQATFLAAMHVLVYTGAIMVLFLFVIMLLNLGKDEMGPEYPWPFRILVGILAVAVFALLAYVFAGTDLGPPAEKLPEDFGGIESVGKTLFERFVLPFELVSILVIAAIFGGVILARRREDER